MPRPLFTSETIQRALTAAEQGSKPGHGTALIEIEIGGRMHAVLAERINERWTLAGEIAWSTAHTKPEGFVGLRGSW